MESGSLGPRKGRGERKEKAKEKAEKEAAEVKN